MSSVFSGRRMPGWLVLIGAMSALGPFSIDMYLPGFPSIEREFGETGVERTMATFMLGIALGQLLYGPLSDRFGRKPPLYFGLIVYAVGALGCAFATNMTMLMVMRVVQAIGSCSSLVIGRAIVRDRCEPHEAARAYSTLMLIVSVGPILAPTIGGVVVTFLSWRAVFIFQAIGGLALVAAMHFMLVESRDPANVVPLHIGQTFITYGRLLRDPMLVGYALVGGFGMAGLYSYVTGAPLVMSGHYGLTPQQFGWMIGLNGIAFMSASRLNIRALRERTPAEVLARAVWIPVIFAGALALVSYAFDIPLWLTIVLQFCFFISVGRVSPNVSALALAPHAREAGSASALLGSMQSTLGMMAGAAVDVFGNGTLARLGQIISACALLTVISYVATQRARS